MKTLTKTSVLYLQFSLVSSSSVIEKSTLFLIFHGDLLVDAWVCSLSQLALTLARMSCHLMSYSCSGEEVGGHFYLTLLFPWCSGVSIHGWEIWANPLTTIYAVVYSLCPLFFFCLQNYHLHPEKRDVEVILVCLSCTLKLCQGQAVFHWGKYSRQKEKKMDCIAT